MTDAEESFSPKTILITGATSGIGRAAAEALHAQGHCLLLVGRNPERTQAFADTLSSRGATAHPLIADLSVQAEIRRLAETVLEDFNALDVLINNAGAVFQTRDVTVDDYERTWALNHLAYFLLTHLLLDRLKEGAPARVINVASDAHLGGSIHWDDLQLEEEWGWMGWSAYSQSKLANILFTDELARQLEGTGVTANSLHPGFVASRFARNNGRFASALMTLTRPIQRSIHRGAETVIWLASAREAEGITGEYFHDKKPHNRSSEAGDESAGRKLWAISQAQVHLEN